MNYVSDAVRLSNFAVILDEEERYADAIYYYKEASRLLKLSAVTFPDHPNVDSWNSKANDYEVRVDQLTKTVSNNSDETKLTINRSDYQVGQCYFLLKQALDADEAGNVDEALELYKKAVDLAIKAKSDISDNEALSKLNHLALKALDRAEQLKLLNKSPFAESTGLVDAPSCSKVQATNPANRILLRTNTLNLQVAGEDTLTEDEKRVLTVTSMINNHEYVPFMDIDLNERFQYTFEFTDKDGLLKLSPKQKSQFVRWARPHEFCSEPKIIEDRFADFTKIKQTIVSDCSFVASLTVAALYERRFNRKLVTTITFPKTRNGEPIYNPFGKYMIKFYINGVARKVIIDDQLPIGRNNELLCSHSTRRSEIWVSLLEKAYLKVMGGYDFPGSNSNIDLHTLTGWIPERRSIRDDDFNADLTFNMLLNRMVKGDVLVTMATGSLSTVDENRTGLVPTHAYAVLDLRCINNVKLLKLKNPWSHVRWRGNFSELDTRNWTAELKTALKFNPYDAKAFDNGIFWIDYDSVVRYFDVFYMNWNPELFTFTYCVHKSWCAGVGPVKDNYNIGDNPQFCLDVHNNKTGAVWILLSRHITEIDDFRENKEYITVLVYKNNGKKVFYPGDPKPYIDGIRINSPHYLCKIILDEDSPRYFTLVVSQFEKTNTIYYTLRTYSTCEFTLMEFVDRDSHMETVEGKWTASSSGGCKNYPNTYKNNPVYQLEVTSNHSNNHLTIDMKGPKQYSIGVEVRLVKLNDEMETAKFKSLSSGDYRNGFVILEIDDVQSGLYHLIPSTFYPEQEGPFILTVRCTSPITLRHIK